MFFCVFFTLMFQDISQFLIQRHVVDLVVGEVGNLDFTDSVPVWVILRIPRIEISTCFFVK